MAIPDGPSPTQNHLTDVGAFTASASCYGTFDQTGNVYQWNDLAGAAGTTRGLRGNAWNLAGAAVNGFQTNQQITRTFTDNSTVVWTQSFSDWGSPQNYGYEATISTQSYRNTASGGSTQTATHVYGYAYQTPAGKTLKTVTLPNNTNTLGIAMMRGGLYAIIPR